MVDLLHYAGLFIPSLINLQTIDADYTRADLVLLQVDPLRAAMERGNSCR